MEVAKPTLAAANDLADTVLFPAANTVDTTGRIPPEHLDLLAESGFYAMSSPGADIDFATACAITETFAAGCLSTAFVWLQHQGVVRRVAGSPLADELLGDLELGKQRGGIALGGTLPGPPRLRATAVPGGYELSGESPWVTGWGMIDLLLVMARDEHDNLISAIITARESDALRVSSPLRMVAATASSTVTAHFSDLFVPNEAVVAQSPYAEWAERDAAGLRFNGSLALGVTNRCTRLLGPTPLDAELTQCRTRLDTAGPGDLPAARAAADEMAVRASSALVVHTGSRSILLDQHPQRLAREALFLLVFASRKGIRDALLNTLIH
ncbi:MAG TPA: acyl-CoA dehydrogenase family protein [Pseudonocardiaceae bacterium]|nr:acyl-CoA dehydrogenase family protein [Pseudonocardiaceae bacterium]